MPVRFDHHGQPDRWINARARTIRDLAEMLGIAKGILFDGVVDDEEAERLLAWTDAHPDIVDCWPGNVVAQRLRKLFSDGVVTPEEREDLHELLEMLVGRLGGTMGRETLTTALPLCDPPPLIEITDRVFVLTGKFAFGPRGACEEATRRVGGWVEAGVTQQTNYLVIGTFGSRDWSQTSFGRKIEKAVEYREKHGWPRIVAEDAWATQI